MRMFPILKGAETPGGSVEIVLTLVVMYDLAPFESLAS